MSTAGIGWPDGRSRFRTSGTKVDFGKSSPFNLARYFQGGSIPNLGQNMSWEQVMQQFQQSGSPSGWTGEKPPPRLIGPPLRWPPEGGGTPRPPGWQPIFQPPLRWPPEGWGGFPLPPGFPGLPGPGTLPPQPAPSPTTMDDTVLQALMMRLGTLGTGDPQAQGMINAIQNSGSGINTFGFAPPEALRARLLRIIAMLPEAYQPQVRAQLAGLIAPGVSPTLSRPPGYLGPPIQDGTKGGETLPVFNPGLY